MNVCSPCFLFPFQATPSSLLCQSSQSQAIETNSLILLIRKEFVERLLWGNHQNHRNQVWGYRTKSNGRNLTAKVIRWEYYSCYCHWAHWKLPLLPLDLELCHRSVKCVMCKWPAWVLAARPAGNVVQWQMAMLPIKIHKVGENSQA